MSGFSRRGFLKRTFGLLVISTAEPVRLLGRLHPVALHRQDGMTAVGTYRLRVADYPTQEILGIRYGLTEVGSSLKLVSDDRALERMNPDHCKRSGLDNEDYPIAVVRIKEAGEDAFTAVSTWCPHNAGFQLNAFEYQLGESGLFVCRRHEYSAFTADGRWIPPERNPFGPQRSIPPQNEFGIASNLDSEGNPFLTRFRTSFDGEWLTIFDILCECEECISDVEESGTDRTLSLEQNSPNPVLHTTLINFSLPVRGDVSLTILTTAGETAAVPLQEHLEAGDYTVEFDASDLSSGSYFYRLETPSGIRTRRMTVVK